VRTLAPGTSWEQARALCRGLRVLVDGEPVADPVFRPDPASRVELAGGVGAGANAPPAPPRLPSLVVYSDADVVVVRKPAGMMTVPFERGDRDTLLALVRVALRRLEANRAAAAVPGAGGAGSMRSTRSTGRVAKSTLRAVQRLDKETSGLLVFARTVAAQRSLQLQLENREVVRRYEALAHGAVEAAVHDTWLVEDRGDGRRGSLRQPATAGDMSGARQAVTRVWPLEALRGATRVACELETGRQHQIRIHLAEAGHPLLGETVYIRDYRGKPLAAPRPMLHAAVLGFRHPRDGRVLRFEDPPPDDFAAVLARLRRGAR
jgi:23S rRNA pseudouridine1911/1915/1917 synthase